MGTHTPIYSVSGIIIIYADAIIQLWKREYIIQLFSVLDIFINVQQASLTIVMFITYTHRIHNRVSPYIIHIFIISINFMKYNISMHHHLSQFDIIN